MDAINPFKSSGWKRAARVNCTILAVLSATLIGLSSIALSYGFKTALFFYAGSCSDRNVTTINIALHLLINVVSTLVYVTFSDTWPVWLASSNFFMQVLNSPSREEIDRAHAAGSWLDVGVSSIRNTFRLSKFKSSCWTVLFLSSVPIHLLFNSAVFRTDYRGADFHLTIATEEFTKDATYYPPGASLLFPGLSSVDLDEYKRDPSISNYDTNGVAEGISDYGFQVPPSDYDDESSPVLRNISTTAKDAGQWTKLDADACKKAYASCRGLSEYRNVVLVANKPGGWVRNDMWELRSNESRFWDRYVPPDQPNHLFFDAQCSVHSTYDSNRASDCTNVCMGALGKPLSQGYYGLYAANMDSPDIEADWTSYSFINISVLEAAYGKDSKWGLEGYQLHHTASDFRPSALDLSIDYCLVQPIETTCLIKMCTAIIVTTSIGHARQESLVTPGDAIASFITQPDVVTAGCTTMVRGSYGLGYYQRRVLPKQQQPHHTIELHVGQFSAVSKYTAAFTHILLFYAQEWAQFGYGFFPLRVTDPKPVVDSSQHLSALGFGEYYLCYDISRGLPADAATLVGYSPTALLTLTVVSIILAFIPPIWSSLTRLPPNIVVPGCNSLAISAACHVSELCHATGKADNSNDTTSPASSAFSLQRVGTRSLGRDANYELLGDGNRESSIDDVDFEKSGENRLERIAQSKLSWGVISMPQEWYARHGYDPMLIKHLGFGVVKDGMAPPLWGHLYG
ncbi:hypothetical protein FHL15_003251 [Xylaria flabelliformis]|uniref:DUF6536 domain-containing protein n=1 Tax=Xylaria flabelliformis TaxID=2512241 RepID=A0A553I670_9PEZI|nr:hypothetical protein FHL15_003251 [Xylaria flabelliformis]